MCMYVYCYIHGTGRIIRAFTESKNKNQPKLGIFSGEPFSLVPSGYLT